MEGSLARPQPDSVIPHDWCRRAKEAVNRGRSSGGRKYKRGLSLLGDNSQTVRSYGQAIGQTINDQGGTNFHWDTSLTSPPPNTNSFYEISMRGLSY